MAHGGQNPVEPIITGKPVIFGPHMDNFAMLAMSLVANNGAIQVNDAGELESAAEKLLRDGENATITRSKCRESFGAASRGYCSYGTVDCRSWLKAICCGRRVACNLENWERHSRSQFALRAENCNSDIARLL